MSALDKQYEKAKNRGWLPFFAASAARHGFSQADLMAIASRESNMENIIGDFGKGFSLMQLDIGSHKAWIESGAWKNVDEAIERGTVALKEKQTQILKTTALRSAKVKFSSGKTVSFTPKALTDEALRHCTLAAYNCGGASYYHYCVGHDIDAGTTQKNYGRDVIARSAHFQTLIDKEIPSALDQVPSESSFKWSNVKDKISSDSAKAIATKAALKASAPISTAWYAGIHGKILIVLIALSVLGFGGYEVWKHRERIKAFFRG